MYGNFCFWAWFRYWYLDSANLVSLLLLDKGYFDYDFEKVEAPEVIGNWEETIKTDEEVDSILSIFGLSSKRTKTTEEIQEYIINQIKED